MVTAAGQERGQELIMVALIGRERLQGLVKVVCQQRWQELIMVAGQQRTGHVIHPAEVAGAGDDALFWGLDDKISPDWLIFTRVFQSTVKAHSDSTQSGSTSFSAYSSVPTLTSNCPRGRHFNE